MSVIQKFSELTVSPAAVTLDIGDFAIPKSEGYSARPSSEALSVPLEASPVGFNLWPPLNTEEAPSVPLEASPVGFNLLPPPITPISALGSPTGNPLQRHWSTCAYERGQIEDVGLNFLGSIIAAQALLVDRFYFRGSSAYEKGALVVRNGDIIFLGVLKKLGWFYNDAFSFVCMKGCHYALKVGQQPLESAFTSPFQLLSLNQLSAANSVGNFGLSWRDLNKFYPGKGGNTAKYAVQVLSFALRQGECFGLFGPNGVGPTTLINMAVDESLKSVNLVYTLAGNYSGGMKRRLSVAISLFGDPKVVYMNAPRTGWDQTSRYDLCNVVKHAKQGRANILTTHAMEEAAVLCDRLGIIVDGSLQSIGNPKKLNGSAEQFAARQPATTVEFGDFRLSSLVFMEMVASLLWRMTFMTVKGNNFKF
ncbi:uncharacterized protein [Aristolochia californica]|uniref:uncharacterized protein n=1 Tax=Aristolochia californica TaxID=171875 RepID=UPI0035D722BB